MKFPRVKRSVQDLSITIGGQSDKRVIHKKRTSLNAHGFSRKFSKDEVNRKNLELLSKQSENEFKLKTLTEMNKDPSKNLNISNSSLIRSDSSMDNVISKVQSLRKNDFEKVLLGLSKSINRLQEVPSANLKEQLVFELLHQIENTDVE